MNRPADLDALGRALAALDALPSRRGIAAPLDEAQIVTEQIRAYILGDKATLWRLQGRYRADPRQAALVTTLEHVEARLLILDGLTRYLAGLLTQARTAHTLTEEDTL